MERDSRIVIDAYIAGVPLIASDWNMNTEVITEKTGVIIPPKDEEALYNCNEKLHLGTLRFNQR